MIHSEFLTAICEQPYEDTYRLVYADWLQEQGHEDRAEFIRIQCELHKYKKQWVWLENMPLQQWSGSDAEREILTRLEPLVKRHTVLCHRYVVECRTWSREFAKTVFGSDWLNLSASWYWGWSRGFVTDVHCTIQEFRRFGPSLVQITPLERVEIYSAVRGLTVFRGEGEGDLPSEIFDYLKRGQKYFHSPYSGTHCYYLVDSGLSDCVDEVERNKKASQLAVEDVSQSCIRWARKKAGLSDVLRIE